MATRNLTPVYRKYRDALWSVRVPSVPSPSSYYGPSTSSSGVGPVIEMVNSSLLQPNRTYAPLSTEDPRSSGRGALTVGLPPAWVDVSEEISVDIQQARTKMSELVKAHLKALMPSFGDGKEDQHAIEFLTQDITKLLKRSENRLKKLSLSGRSEDSNVQKNVQEQNSLSVCEPGAQHMEPLLKAIYELYTDFVLKNPFYEMEMPIPCELFDLNLSQTTLKDRGALFGRQAIVLGLRYILGVSFQTSCH